MFFHYGLHKSNTKKASSCDLRFREPNARSHQTQRVCETIRELTHGLAHETDSRENRFREPWGEALAARYETRPGSPVVHLDDLPGHSMVFLNPEGRLEVKRAWCLLVQSMGARWASDRFRRIANYLSGRAADVSRLKTWKDFGDLIGFEVNQLEPFVRSIRLSDGAHIRTLSRPKLPFNLATPSGGRLIGYFGDLNSRNGAFSNKVRLLHKDFRMTIREVFGNLSMTETALEHGGFGEGHYLRTNVGYLIPAALTIAGYDCGTDQKLSNNPIPSWLFECDNVVKAECLSSLWDTEGSVNFRDLKVRQAVSVQLHPYDAIPVWPSTKAFRQLAPGNQAAVLERPPLLLVSAALLLFSLGIESRLVPTGTAMSSGVATAYWHLRVHRDRSIRTFRTLVSLRSPEKKTRLRSFQ